ncbi:MAG TPA: hypothetical protein VH063_17860 [Gaiellaceae bacterium]|jgi:hypothetical protein|nr:hypothetical protein [Gaiellaceae bacterium]
MARRLVLVVVVVLVLVLAPAALADGGPSPGASNGGVGVVGGGVRYIAVGGGRTTVLEAVARHGGQVSAFVTLRGGWGIPTVSYDGTTGGLSANRASLILEPLNPFTCVPERCTWTTTRFDVFTPSPLRRRADVVLHGRFAYDAISPDGRMLYLIQYVSETDQTRYLVRAYDLDRGRLLSRAIADRTQRGWVMQGSPMSRTTSPGGRFVYTLFENPGGYPFVHALDTVRGVAHCVGIPWTGAQTEVGALRLTLRDGGRTLAIGMPPGRRPIASPSFLIDTRTYAVSVPSPSAHGGFRWWLLGLLVVPLALGAGAIAVRRGSSTVVASSNG